MAQTFAQLVKGISANSAPANSLNIDSSGRVGIGTTSPNVRLTCVGATSIAGATNVSARFSDDSNSSLYIASPSAGVAQLIGNNLLSFATSDGAATSERARIDSSGRLLVGTSSSRNGGYADPAQVQIEGLNYNAAAQSIILNSNDGNAPSLNFGKSRGTSLNSSTVVQSGDRLGVIDFAGADGTSLKRGAVIEALVDGTPGANDMPGRLVFYTTADGSASPTERIRINSGGDIFLLSTKDQTTASGANVFIDSTSGVLRRSTSSIKYKTNVETLQDSYADAILNCRPVWYQSTSDYDKQEWGYWGFIAEEVAEIDPRLCFFAEKEDGSLEPEGVQYDRFVPHLLNLIKRQGAAIAELQAEVAALKNA